LGLAFVYLEQEKLDIAEASLQKALDCSTVAHDILNQGNILNTLGRLYMKRSQFKDAQCMFKGANDKFKEAQNVPLQDIDLKCLNDVISQIV
jgi:uncharacterized protein HemY